MERLDIVQICPCYVDIENETGGVANIVRQISLNLAAAETRVTLICGNRELGRIKAAPGTRRISDFLTVEVLPQRRHPALGPGSVVRNRILSLPPDCIAHVHTCFSSFTEGAMKTLSSRNIPFIFTPHGKLSGEMFSNGYWSKKIWWSLWTARLIRSAAGIALSSSAEAHLFPKLGLPNSFHVIPNGFEAPSSVADQTLAREILDPYVLFLGYVDPRKQPELLAAAFSKATSRQTHRLVYVGPDTYGQKTVLDKVINDYGIQDRVIFLGPVYGPRKWGLLRYADCLCLPSRAEGLPVVLCEAMGAGLPSIYSKECNFPEVADRGAGIMMEGFSDDTWAAAIDKICLDPAVRFRMGEAGKNMSVDYRWKKIAQQWSALYGSFRLQSGANTGMRIGA